MASVTMALAAVALMSRRQKRSNDAEATLIGSIAVVEIPLEPEGAVLVRGRLWRARSSTGETIERHCYVSVVGTAGHLLTVELRQQ